MLRPGNRRRPGAHLPAPLARRVALGVAVRLLTADQLVGLVQVPLDLLVSHPDLQRLARSVLSRSCSSCPRSRVPVLRVLEGCASPTLRFRDRPRTPGPCACRRSIRGSGGYAFSAIPVVQRGQLDLLGVLVSGEGQGLRAQPGLVQQVRGLDLPVAVIGAESAQPTLPL
jgi:hypothetical protein